MAGGWAGSWSCQGMSRGCIRLPAGARMFLCRSFRPQMPVRSPLHTHVPRQPSVSHPRRDAPRREAREQQQQQQQRQLWYSSSTSVYNTKPSLLTEASKIFSVSILVRAPNLRIGAHPGRATPKEGAPTRIKNLYTWRSARARTTTGCRTAAMSSRRRLPSSRGLGVPQESFYVQ